MTPSGGQMPFVKVGVALLRFIRQRDHTERAISVNNLELLVATFIELSLLYVGR
jgi:hypothetical protein